LTILLPIFLTAEAQQKQIIIRPAVSDIQIDGLLDEPAWKDAAVANSFFQSYPSDTGLANYPTEVRITHDDEMLYIGVTCYRDPDIKYYIETLKRDFNFRANDAFFVLLDPFRTQTNAFLFSVNAYGAEMEALISGGGSRPDKANKNWDDKWYSATRRYPDHWSAEMAIPFSTLRFDGSSDEWLVNFVRNDIGLNEMSNWSFIPTSQAVENLTYTGQMRWEQMPQKTKANIALIPYGLGSLSADFENNTGTTLKGNTGLDAKIAVTPSLNLDLTLNPDFSQIEVDEQQVDLTRFELFYPEKRTFFLENSDLLEGLGILPARPFFSRRIGLYRGETVPILAGARLSGNFNENWRINALSMQTARKDSLNLLSQNYFAAALERQVLERSRVTAFLVNRQAFDSSGVSALDFNRVGGLEFNFVSINGEYTAKTYYNRAFTPENFRDAASTGLITRANTDHYRAVVTWEYIGENFIADMGFVPQTQRYNPLEDSVYRVGYYASFQLLSLKLYPGASWLYMTGPEYNGFYNWDPELRLTDYNINLKWYVWFNNRSRVSLNYERTLTTLLFPTDITGSQIGYLPAGAYHYQGVSLNFGTNTALPLSGNGNISYGSFYSGTRLRLKGQLNYKLQPWGTFSLSWDQNKIDFPDSIGDAMVLLIGSRIALTFSKNIYWTTFLQYNTQEGNFNINSRFQWRFRPMSDIYLVYTDNYYVPGLGPRNRALVLKVNYWLNL